jgi:hypothetical protein
MDDEREESALGAVASGVAPLHVGATDDPSGGDGHNGSLPPGGEPGGMDDPGDGADR